MTPDEEFAHYADPANQTPQGKPVLRLSGDRKFALSIACPSCGAYAGKLCQRESGETREWPHAKRVVAARHDPLLREMAKRCAACGHAQMLHCDHTGGHADDPCGCISHPDTPPEDRCRCTRFLDPDWIAELRDYYENSDRSESLREATFEPGSDPEVAT